MNSKYRLEDYKVIKKIGRGSFGQILLVDRYGYNFAMKKISKKQILKVNKMHEPFIQREILFRFAVIAPEYFVLLHETHSDNEFIYMIMEICEGSMDLVLQALKSIENKKEVIKRIIVKMVMTLEIMHKYGVIHRDLKPSNFLFKADGTIKLADFGTAYAEEQFFSADVAKNLLTYRQMSKKKQSEKIEIQDQSTETSSRRATFVGTPLYMAPQLLDEDYCGPEADLWALGCIIYELIYGKPPFYDENQGLVWKKIMNQQIDMSKSQRANEDLKNIDSLINSLLKKDRTKRLGFGLEGYKMLKSHRFFEGVDWEYEKGRPIKEISVYLSSLKCEPQISFKREQRILLSGAVNKKMFFGNFKQRMLVLHSTPKLVYFDIETGEKKGEILLTKDTPIGSEGTKIFTITTTKKTYYFKSRKSSQWIQMIKLAVVSAYF